MVYVKVQRSVVVVVEPYRAGEEPRFIESGLFGYVGEGSVVVVVVEDQSPVGGHQKIGPTVTVIVRGGHSNAEVSASNASLLSYLSKCAIVIVVIQGVMQGRGGRKKVGRSTVDEVQINPTIIVVVKDGYTRTHRLGKIAARRHGIVVLPGDAGSLRGPDFEI